MLVLSHRGYWSKPEERNTTTAFTRSFDRGFGIETDFRDFNNVLVVSHDPPGSEALPAEKLFSLHLAAGRSLPIAMNVKADGLQTLIREIIDRHQVQDYFVFDMSVPDALGYVRSGLPVFTRQSEYEPSPAYYSSAAGVWMDMFHSEWITPDDISRHLDTGKRVCIVSPELHRREHRRFWDALSGDSICLHPSLMICTDLPEDAREMFCG